MDEKLRVQKSHKKRGFNQKNTDTLFDSEGGAGFNPQLSVEGEKYFGLRRELIVFAWLLRTRRSALHQRPNRALIKWLPRIHTLCSLLRRARLVKTG